MRAAIADQIVDGKTDVFDLDSLTLDRFDAGERRIEPERIY
jgi:hypothetical protein